MAPASPYDRELFARGKRRLQQWGYAVRCADGLRAQGQLVAASRSERLDELHGAFADPDVDAVMAIRGGYGVMHLLPHIDWDLLRDHPKLLIGLSDLTPLLNATVERAGLVTLHGPMVVGLGGNTDDESVRRLQRAMTDPRPLPPIVAEGSTEQWCLAPGRARGLVCGGNLSLVAATVGTPFELVSRDRIVLLEEVEEPPYRIDRLLTQLRLAGLFDRCAAVGFGEMVGCEPPDGVGYALRDVVRDVLSDLPVPMLWGLPFGHGSRNWAFPVGVRGELDASRGRVSFLEPALRDAPDGRPDRKGQVS